MTQAEREYAFRLRCRGYTWEQIGAALHYDGHSVAQDLWRMMRRPPYVPPIRYPRIAAYVSEHTRGSINAFASALRVSPSRLRAVLIRGEEPGEALCSKLCAALHALPEEVFSVE